MLLVAAVDDGVDAHEILHASARVVGSDVGAAALGPAIDAGLVSIDGAELAFRHPLVRSAIYQRAAESERRAVHAAIAALLVDDLERRVAHWEAATLRTDDELADELQSPAERAQRRGAPLAAALGLERSAGFATDPTKRVERLLAAAEIAFELGSKELAQRLLEKVQARELSSPQRGRVEYLAEIFDAGRSGDPVRVLALVSHAEDAARSGDSSLAMRLL